jgi:acyl-CoA synthetase (NDP forming)/RimJ/RimL family protein N-acetyltransferase
MTTTNHLAPNPNDAPTTSFGNAGSLDAIFNPRTVAIIDADQQPGTMGQKTLSAVRNSEFRGSTFVVQPEQSFALGKSSYPSLSAVPGKVDLAVVITPPETAPEILAECVGQDVRGIILISSGFGANGGHHAEAVNRVRTILRGSRTRVIGPKSLGIMNPLIGLNATPGLQMAIGGTVAFLSESAILGRFVLDWSLKHIVGFSAFASLGTMLDVSWANLIDYFGRDPYTRTIAIQISSIGDARSFISAAREVSLSKPIIVIKTGRDDASIRAVGWASHCVLSDDDVLMAALRRVGVLQVDTLEDLFYAADALSKQPRPRGPRLMIVSNADGAGVLAADSVVRSGVEVARPSAETREQLCQLLPGENRLDDVMGDGSAESFVKAVEVSAKDPDCDGLLLLMLPWAISDPQRTAERLLELRNSCTKPILISYMGSPEIPAAQESLLRACIPTFSSPGAAARVFKYMWRYSYDLQSLYETPILHIDLDKLAPRTVVRNLIDAARRAGQTSLTSAESRQILAMYGIPTLEDETGQPDGNGGYRAKVGCRIDSQFGPVLMFGSADRGKDVYGDLVVGLPPLNSTLARRMLEQSQFYAALRVECDSASILALEALLVRFSQLVVEQPWIKKFEIHPLLISRGHLLALGGHCELHGSREREDELPRSAIRPYPVQYVSSWTMKNGQSVTLRPIRAEDEPLMIKFHEGLSDRSVYLRYFQRVQLRTRTAHERLSRVCFLDYDRELALLAEHRDPQTTERKIIAIATLVKLQPRGAGEVAVLISDDYHGQGLGTKLIARLVCFARDEGLQRVVASTMLENAGMCAIFQKLGFQLSTNFEVQLIDAKLVLE